MMVRNRDPASFDPTMTAPLRRYLPPILLILLTALAFSPLLRADFTSWDDYNTVARNWRMRPPSIENTLYYWRHSAMDLYIPVTYTVWSIVAAIADRHDAASSLNPAIFHAANIAMHIFCALAVYALIRRLLRAAPWSAFLGAAIFALHPIQVEPVAWISGMKDLLCGFLCILALIFYSADSHDDETESTMRPASGAAKQPLRVSCPLPLRGKVRERAFSTTERFSTANEPAGRSSPSPKHEHQDHSTHSRRRIVNFSLATLFFILALLSKPTAVILPLIAITLDLFFLARPIRQARIRWLIWFLVAIPCVLWTRHFQPASPLQPPPLLERPLVAADAITFYLRKLIAPIHLCIDYGHSPAGALATTARYTWIIPLLIAIALICEARLQILFPRLLRSSLSRPARGARSAPPAQEAIPTRSPLIAAAILFLIPLLPVLGLVPFDFQAYSTVADHYLYLPMLGVAAAVAYLSMRIFPRIIFTIAILIFIPLSIQQTRSWQNSDALFDHVLTINPRSFAAHNSLAAAAIERNDFTSAETHARAALAIDPDNITARVHLAAALAQLGEKPRALQILRQAIAIDPTSPSANINLAGLLADLHDPSAEAHLRRAITLAPDDPSPYSNLGALLASTNRLDEARENLAIAMRLSPADARIRTNYAIVLAAQGHPAEAAAQLRRALQIDPDFAPAKQALSDLTQTPSTLTP
jgi:protein O-mannosyl-transferase